MNLTNALGWTLLHFVWQGILIALALSGALALLRRARPHVRYAVNCAALVVMFGCALATFLALAVSEYRHTIRRPPASWPLALANEVRSVAGAASPAALRTTCRRWCGHGSPACCC